MGAAGREKIQDYSLEKVLAEMAAIYNCYLNAGGLRRGEDPDGAGEDLGNHEGSLAEVPPGGGFRVGV